MSRSKEVTVSSSVRYELRGCQTGALHGLSYLLYDARRLQRTLNQVIREQVELLRVETRRELIKTKR